MRRIAFLCLLICSLVTGRCAAQGTTLGGSTTISVGPATVINLTAVPGQATVITSATQNFTVSLANDGLSAGASVALSGPTCSGGTCGTVSSALVHNGDVFTYTAPSSVPATPTVNITVTSIQDSTRFVVSVVTVAAPNPGGGASPVIIRNVTPAPVRGVAASRTYPTNATVGNMIAVGIVEGQGANFSTVTDNAPGGTNSYVDSGCQADFVGGAHVGLFYAVNAKTGVTQITVVDSVAISGQGIIVWDISNAASVPLVGTASCGGSTTPTTTPVGPTATGVTNGVVLSVIGTGTTNSVNSPFVFDQFGSPSNGMGGAHFNVLSNGTYGPTWNTTSSAWAGITASFASGNQPAVIAVNLNPATASVQVNASTTFIPTVTNDSTNPPQVTLALTGGGCSGATCGALSASTANSGSTITYTAPPAVPSPATVTLTATSVTDGSKTKTSTITVTASPVISVAVTPHNPSLTAGGATQQFIATLTNDPANHGVNWTFGNCTGVSCGTLSPTSSLNGVPVTYTPPASVTTTQSISLTATSVTDGTKTDTATILVNPPAGGGGGSGSQHFDGRAFPEAQGGGAASKGGRGGTVIEVTNLNDSGTGSLRACAEGSGARICVFRVSGLIIPQSQIFIGSPFLTIAGQTAPGEIIIGGPTTPQEAGIRISTHDVVIQYVTFSPDNRNVISGPSSGTVGYYVANTQDFNNIADHISSRWAGNKEIAIYAGFAGEYNKDYTLQNSLLYEPHAGHPVGPSISENDLLSNTQASHNVDFHHNMLVNFSHRLPEYNHSPARWTNNITHNWYFYALAALGATQTDVIGNIWSCANLNSIGGAQTYPIHSTDGNWAGSLPGTPSFYVSGNIGCGHTTPNTDQYGDLTRQITGENGNELGTFPSSWKRATPLAASNAFPITVDPATNLSATLLPIIGNSRHLDCTGEWATHRDAADSRIIAQYQAGGNGGFWPNGVTTPINNQTSPSQIPVPTANWTDQPVTNFPVCVSTLHDGIPDAWRARYGVAASANTVDPVTGWTYLEDFLYHIVP